MSRMNFRNAKIKQLQALRDVCKTCVMCPLGREKHVHKFGGKEREIDPRVFSTLNFSRFMIIGQNPGGNECIKDEPFVGEAGANFNKAIEEHGLSRSDFYITNICKCHTPQNRKPASDEIERCFPYLQFEINLLNPKFVITLGASAFNQLCPNLSFGDNLGKFSFSTIIEKKVFPIYHPSPRNLNIPSRRAIFQRDIKSLCSLIKALQDDRAN